MQKLDVEGWNNLLMDRMLERRCQECGLDEKLKNKKKENEKREKKEER